MFSEAAVYIRKLEQEFETELFQAYLKERKS